MRRPVPTAESRARAERIARSLAGQLEDLPAPRSEAGKRAAPRPGPGLTCPRCLGAMQAVGTNQGVEIDQCLECGAVWFDAGELEAVLAGAESGAEAPAETLAEVRARMTGVAPQESTVRYLECPRCREVMGRRNFGTISGVVVDECRRHGVLLDAGELQAIESFVKMGGPQIGAQVRVEQGLRSLPPPPEPLRPGEVRTTARGAAQDVVANTLTDTIWNLLFRW